MSQQTLRLPRSVIATSLIVCLLSLEQLGLAQQAETFKVKYVGGYPGVPDKNEGQVLFDNEAEALVFLKGGKQRMFSIPYAQITVVSADERARRRVKETVILGVTLIGLFALPILFSKKKMRFVLVEFSNPERKTAGAALFRVKRRHKVGLMVAIAGKSDLERRGEELYAREGILTEESLVEDAETSGKPKEQVTEGLCMVSVSSRPAAADVELDGKFVGNTPIILKLRPGQYQITVKKDGFTEWSRSVEVLVDNETKLVAELTKLAPESR